VASDQPVSRADLVRIRVVMLAAGQAAWPDQWA
jgi:hypothetical protein